MGNLKCDELLRKIQELEFTAVDLNLFLDNHPTSQPALSDYNTITEELRRLKKIYETNFGPLTNFGFAPSQYPWRWVNEPWPWEMKG
ncbi:MAG TPA: spore coat protein CotJB [Clostridiaceae bacterium]|nr:spore coat protein CotJB [Clostridiaceae bacterium]